MGACTCGYSTDPEKNCNGTHNVVKAVKADIIAKLDDGKSQLAGADGGHEALRLGTEHLSCYEVIYEEDTPLFHQLKAGEFSVDEDLACSMYDELVERSASRGFTQYEIANFAQGEIITFGGLPELDHLNRPKAFFGDSIHDRCYRRPFYDKGQFAKTFDDDRAADHPADIDAEQADGRGRHAAAGALAAERGNRQRMGEDQLRTVRRLDPRPLGHLGGLEHLFGQLVGKDDHFAHLRGGVFGHRVNAIGAVFDGRIKRDRTVLRNGPRRRGPDDVADGRSTADTEHGGQCCRIIRGETDIDREAGLVLVLDFCFGQRGAAVQAPVHRLEAAGHVAVGDDPRQHPQL